MQKVNRPSRTGERGYTLIELLVVLAVISLLVMATPAIVSAARPGVEAKAAAYALADTLRLARNAAVIADAERVVRLHLDRKVYETSDGRSRQLPEQVSWEFLGKGRERDSDEVELRFFPDGSSSGGRIRIQGAGQDREIVSHALTGRISIDE